MTILNTFLDGYQVPVFVFPRLLLQPLILIDYVCFSWEYLFSTLGNIVFKMVKISFFLLIEVKLKLLKIEFVP